MGKQLIYFGHSRKDIYSILAEEEAMLQLTQDWGKPLFMTRMVSRPAATVAEREDINDIKTQECAEKGIDFTRRLGGGSVIWLDDGMLAYFLTIPKDWIGSRTLANEFAFHQEISKRIAIAIKNFGISRIYVGEKFSIALGPAPKYVISGNAATIKSKYLAYHGVLVLRKLDVATIKKYIVLRKNEKVDEAELLVSLPDLRSATKKTVSAKQISCLLAESISDKNLRRATRSERKMLTTSARGLVDKYKNPSWIFEPESIIERNAGFCLVALSETWKEKNFYPV